VPTSLDLYEEMIDTFGPPVGASPLTEADVSRYRGRIPDTFLDFIKPYGFGMWMEGYWQFSNPEDFRDLLPLIFGNDPDFRVEEMHVIGFSAFGGLLIWNETYKSVTVRLLQSELMCLGYVQPGHPATADLTLAVSLANVDSKAGDVRDVNDEHLFKRCLKAHGQLELGQIYAPVLPPVLGGQLTLKNFTRTDAGVALSIMAQWERIKIVDYSTLPEKFFRVIG
jgi:hypothetical protein